MINAGNFGVIKPDIFQEIRKINGSLDEKEAQMVLARLLVSQPNLLYNLLTGETLFPFQTLKCKMFMERDFILDVSSRGGAKSFTSAVFAIIYAICNPGNKILILGPGMRQSAVVLAYIMEISKKPSAYLLRQFLSEDNYKRSPERHSIKIGNSEVFAMSLGDGKKIRGARANVIILDEAFAIPSNIIDEVIGPMMVVPANINEIRKTRKWEDRMIAAGKMTEKERMVFPNNKMIMLSSACYEFEPLYKRFLDYKDKILDKNFLTSDEHSKTQLSYGIVNLGWEALPDELLSKGFILSEKSRMSEDSFRREYEAQFSPDSSSYYKMSKMKECCLQPREYPTIEFKGDSPVRYFYVLGIDPNYKNAENSDHFAMCLMKVDRKKMNIGTVVHNYAMAGLDTDSIMKYILYLLTHFNIEYMIVDSGGGISLIETINNSSLFKTANIQLGVVDFKFDDPKEIRESKSNYNPKERKMVHLQNFGGKWIQLANQELQMCFDHKKVRFASMPMDSDYESLLKEDIPIKDIEFKLKQEEDLKGVEGRYKMKEKQRQFLEHQRDLIELTINECANVQLTTTAQGNQSFDLPTSMRKINTPDKPRKDSYTALLLANWGRKCVEMMELCEEDEKPNDWFEPVMF